MPYDPSYYEASSAEERAFLDAYDPSKFPIFTVTVDAVVLGLVPGHSFSTLLVRRRNYPFKDYWALPGGFINPDEHAGEAADRELHEEVTGLDSIPLTQIGAFSEPRRDPRGPCISLAYMGCVRADALPEIEGADDATEARWFSATDVPVALAFDHATILRVAWGEWRKWCVL